METGDILRLDLETGPVLFWEVKAFYHGTADQESVMHLMPLGREECSFDAQSSGIVPELTPDSIMRAAIGAGVVKLYSRAGKDGA